jgi:hypothetical protein
MSKNLFLKFTALAALGLATSFASAATKTIEFGETTVTLDPGFVSALQSLNLNVDVISPSRANLSQGVVSFPAVAGAVDLVTAKGEIIHSGGLILSAGTTTVRLQSFTIDTTGASGGLVLTGLVTVNDTLVGRLPLFNLQLPPGFTTPLQASNGFLTLNGVVLNLNATAAGALNSTFNTNALPTTGAFLIGTANVAAFVGTDPLLELFGQLNLKNGR